MASRQRNRERRGMNKEELDEYEWIASYDRPHRSVSQLTGYSACSEQHRLRRVARVPQRPAAWLVQGKAAHAALEAWELDRSISMLDLEDIYIIAYRNEANALVEKWPDEGHWLTGGSKKGFQDLSDREDRGWVQCLDYISMARSEAHLWRVADVERKFLLEFGGIPVLGYIDQIAVWADGTLQVRDLKTGTMTPATAIQLVTYSKVLERVLGVKVRNPSFIKLCNPNGRSEKAKSTQQIEIELDRQAAWENPDFLGQMFRDADRGISEGIFLPNPTDACARTCDVRQFCRDQGFASSAEDHLEGVPSLAGV